MLSQTRQNHTIPNQTVPNHTNLKSSLNQSKLYHSKPTLNLFIISQNKLDFLGATYFLLRQIINGKLYKRTETTYENIESN